VDVNELIGIGLLVKAAAGPLGQAHLAALQTQGKFNLLQLEHDRVSTELQTANANLKAATDQFQAAQARIRELEAKLTVPTGQPE
jgi:hypothetical protein